MIKLFLAINHKTSLTPKEIQLQKKITDADRNVIAH